MVLGVFSQCGTTILSFDIASVGCVSGERDKLKDAASREKPAVDQKLLITEAASQCYDVYLTSTSELPQTPTCQMVIPLRSLWHQDHTRHKDHQCLSRSYVNLA